MSFTPSLTARQWMVTILASGLELIAYIRLEYLQFVVATVIIVLAWIFVGFVTIKPRQNIQ